MMDAREKQIDEVVRKSLGIAPKNSDVIGSAPNNEKKNTNGMDDIDNWAASIGKAERTSRSFRPKTPHKSMGVQRIRT